MDVIVTLSNDNGGSLFFHPLAIQTVVHASFANVCECIKQHKQKLVSLKRLLDMEAKETDSLLKKIQNRIKKNYVRFDPACVCLFVCVCVCV